MQHDLDTAMQARMRLSASESAINQVTHDGSAVAIYDIRMNVHNHYLRVENL